MALQSTTVDYRDGDTLLEGYLAWDDAQSGPRPAVIVSHAYHGRSDFECDKADRLAELGYAAFALDLYGKGVHGSSPEESRELMQPFLVDRAMLGQRLQAVLDTVRELTQVDETRVAAIGFCFGGLCVLDLARSGADIRGVVSLHGLFNPPENVPTASIKAKVLALHGWDDPMAPPESVLALSKELSAAGADWQIHAYGNTMHSFTNPTADNPEGGLAYNEDADRRSWQSVQDFLTEVL